MAFHDTILPFIYSYRSRRELATAVAQFKADSGDLFAFSQQRVLFRYGLTYQNRDYDDVSQLRKFHFCRGGPRNSFRFADPLDRTTASDGFSEPTGLDEPILELDGQFFLAKRYGNVQRVIRLPIPSETLIIMDAGVDVTGSCTVNEYTGEVTGYTPAGAFTAGFYFDIPVRFAESGLSCRWNAYECVDVEFGLSEVLDPLE